MILAIDEAIPYAEQAFAGLGEIRRFPGRKVKAEEVKDVDVLIVRSITNVDAALLDGSSIRFVGTATIGTDHFDQAYLDARGIRSTNAAGSNANAVAEYVTAALLVIAERKGWDLSKKTIAVVGVGNVGSRVALKARALGMRVFLCDPPLRESTGDKNYQFLDDVIHADILTFHVPLIKGGPYPTQHMADRAMLDRLRPGQYLINSARGPVFDCKHLKTRLEEGAIAGATLDVWEGEPRIDYSLLDRVDIGSPHIAGYSLDGKVRATEMIVEELCRFFKLPYKWDCSSIFPPVARLRPASGARGQDAIRSVVLQAYDILRDDSKLRALKSLPPEEARTQFDRQRNEYPLRAEFRHYMVELPKDLGVLAPTFEGLGFQVKIQ